MMLTTKIKSLCETKNPLQLVKGHIIKKEGWELNVRGKSKTFKTDEDIRKIMVKYLAGENRVDYAEDGTKYNFKKSILKEFE